MSDHPFGTPYDDVFRTMLLECSRLIIPVINELFGEHYQGDETISFSPGDHYIHLQSGEEIHRISDSSFIIHGDRPIRYHLECQSGPDKSMIVRMFEYDLKIALDTSSSKDDVLSVELPRSGVLYLRNRAKSLDRLTILFKDDSKELQKQVQIMNIQQYSLDQIFAKKLYFILPFYFFTHEARFDEYNSIKAMNPLLTDLETIFSRLGMLVRSGSISEREVTSIHEMSAKVIRALAHGHDFIQQEVVEKMFGGKVLELEWQKYLEQGRELGLEQGRELGLEQGRELGLEQGRELGLEQGLQQGRKEERADILSVLGISEDDYLKLKAKKEAEKGLVLHEEGLDYSSES